MPPMVRMVPMSLVADDDVLWEPTEPVPNDDATAEQTNARAHQCGISELRCAARDASGEAAALDLLHSTA